MRSKFNILLLGCLGLGLSIFSSFFLKSSIYILTEIFPGIDSEHDTYTLKISSTEEFEVRFKDALYKDSLLLSGRKNGLHNLYDTLSFGNNIIPFMDIRDSLGYPKVIFYGNTKAKGDRITSSKIDTTNTISEHDELWVISGKKGLPYRMFCVYLQDIKEIAIFEVFNKFGSIYLNLLYIQDSWQLHDRCRRLSNNGVTTEIQDKKIYTAFENNFLNNICYFQKSEISKTLRNFFHSFETFNNRVELLNSIIIFLSLIFIFSGLLMRVRNPRVNHSLRHSVLMVGITGTSLCILIVIISIGSMIGLELKYPEIARYEHLYYLKDISTEEFQKKFIESLKQDSLLVMHRKDGILHIYDSILSPSHMGNGVASAPKNSIANTVNNHNIGNLNNHTSTQDSLSGIQSNEMGLIHKEQGMHNGEERILYSVYLNSIKKVAVFYVFKSRKTCLCLAYLQDSWQLNNKPQRLHDSTIAQNIPVDSIYSSFENDFLNNICKYNKNSLTAYNIYQWIPDAVHRFGMIFLIISICCIMLLFSGVLLHTRI